MPICWTQFRGNGSSYVVCIPDKKTKSKSTKSSKSRTKEQNLVKKGYTKRAAKKVASKMKQTGRPASNFSKTTGMLRKDAKKK